jgi:hypothetical protein
MTSSMVTSNNDNDNKLLMKKWNDNEANDRKRREPLSSEIFYY